MRSIAPVPALRHVMLNALFLDPAVSGGPETYLRELAPALAQEAPELRLTVVTTGSGAGALRADGWGEWAAIEALPCEDGQRVRRTVAEQVLLPRLARRSGADVLHSLASVAPVRAGVPSTITVHDVTFLLRRTFDRVTTFGLGQIVARAARRADSLIAVSAAARDEICSVLDLDPARFTVVPHGAGRPAASAPAAESELRERHRLGDSRVVLCVAAKRPHKNQELLLRALPYLPEDALVVLAGHAEPYEARLRELAVELSVSRASAFPRLSAGRRARGAVAARRVRGVPDPRRGLRIARDRGDGAGRAGGVQRPPRAARGRWRGAALLPAIGRPCSGCRHRGGLG